MIKIIKDLKKNYHSKYLLFSLLYLSFYLSQCSNVFLFKPKPETLQSKMFWERVRVLNFSKNLSAICHFNYISNENKGRAIAKLNYHTIDSLNILLRDPLGRKVATLNFLGDEYYLQLLRERKFYNGKELPDPYNSMNISRVSFSDLRKILLAIPIFNYSEKTLKPGKIVKSVTDNGLLVNSFFKINSVILEKIVIFTEKNEPLTTVFYEKYQVTDGIIMPKSIKIISHDNHFNLDLHFSAYSIKNIQ